MMSLNPETESGLENAPDFSGCRTLTEIFAAIESMDANHQILEGSSHSYTPQELARLVDTAVTAVEKKKQAALTLEQCSTLSEQLDNEPEIVAITRSGGLRDSVISLLRKLISSSGMPGGFDFGDIGYIKISDRLLNRGEYAPAEERANNQAKYEAERSARSIDDLIKRAAEENKIALSDAAGREQLLNILTERINEISQTVA